MSIKDVFGNEKKFSAWLAEKENLACVSDKIGINLEFMALEGRIGSFRADILCRDGEGKNVVIENQKGKTDHKHLGQIEMYAPGLDAVAVVWIAEEFRDEHRAKLDHLNQNEGLRYFGLEVVSRKDDSKPVCEFYVVSPPPLRQENPAKRIHESARTEVRPSHSPRSQESGGFADTEYSKYFDAFKEFAKEKGNTWIPDGRPHGNRLLYDFGKLDWQNWSCGKLFFRAKATQRPGDICIDLVFEGKDTYPLYPKLREREREITEKLGFSEKIRWVVDKETKKGEKVAWKRVEVTKPANILDKEPSRRDCQFRWMKEHLEAFYRTFLPILNELRQPNT